MVSNSHVRGEQGRNTPFTLRTLRALRDGKGDGCYRYSGHESPCGHVSHLSHQSYPVAGYSRDSGRCASSAFRALNADDVHRVPKNLALFLREESTRPRGWRANDWGTARSRARDPGAQSILFPSRPNYSMKIPR